MSSPIISITDSYYSYICQQMIALNAQVLVNGNMISQPMCSVVQARDWPLTPDVEGGLYLLVLDDVQGGKSQAQVEVTIMCQWMWLLIGSDLTASQLGQNRGDRYRANRQIIENLRQASYPGFCQKFDYSVNSSGGLVTQPSTSSFPPSSVEMVRWSRLKVIQRQDNQQSGLLYGSATVDVSGWSDVSLAVA